MAERSPSTDIRSLICEAHHIKDPDILNQFLQEKTLLTSLNHSAIVTVKDLVAEANTLAIITELVDGYSLREYLKAHTNLSPQHATIIRVIQLCSIHALLIGMTPPYSWAKLLDVTI